jgi:hypothetical protein
MFRDARSLVETILNDRTLLPDSEPARPLEVVHKERKCQARTLFGTITLRRRYYHHTRAGTGRCPLDERLDLVRGHMPGLARLVCRASAVSGSYEAAAGDLHAYLGLAIEGRSFGRLVADIVPELRAARDSRPAPVGKEPVAILYAASDGTGVPLRRRELAGIKGRQLDGSARTREVKLGCIFTQTTTDENGEPLRDEASTTYVGTFDDCRAAGTQLRAEALRRGYATAQTTVYLGDGAAWIWENARLNFPGSIEILDFYHASEHAGDLAKALLGAGPEATVLQSDWCHAMKADSSAPVLDAARNLLTARQSELSPEQVETAQREIAYFTTNAARTRYGEFRARCYFIGSGVVEAGCRTVVGRRLKASGMFWSQRGGDDLLTLRCLVLGPTFSDVWKARIPILKAQRAKPPKWSPALN